MVAIAILIAFAHCGIQKKQGAGKCVFTAQCEKPIPRKEKSSAKLQWSAVYHIMYQ